MAKPATKEGRGPCPQCKETVTFKRSAGGLLTYSCDACDSSGYAQQGGTAHAAWMRGVKPAAAPAADTKPAPEPTAAPRAARSAFDLASL